MSKTQKIFRDALDARKPSDREAKEDLERILTRVTHTRERAIFRWAPYAGAASLAIAATVALVFRPAPSDRGANQSSVMSAGSKTRAEDNSNAITIYVRRSGEPETSAMSLTLNVREGI
jgi:hypothetical protein